MRLKIDKKKLKAANFPRFFYSDLKNEGSVGALIYHLNFPRCIFSLVPEEDGWEDLQLMNTIDDFRQEELDKVCEALTAWVGSDERVGKFNK